MLLTVSSVVPSSKYITGSSPCGGVKLVGCAFCASSALSLSVARFCAAASDICSARLKAAWAVLDEISVKPLAVFWLLARKVLRLPGWFLAAPCKAPSNPPGLADSSSDSWASLSQFGAVLEARLTGAMAIRAEPNGQASIYRLGLNEP